MAESRVIDAYLTELRYSVDKLVDADEIVDEAADHLYTALDQLIAQGISTTEAEAQVLGRFGSATLVAKVFAEEAKRGGAVSTTLTRRAGVAAMATVPLIVIGQAGNDLTSRGLIHGAFVAMEVAAFFTFCFAVWGIRRRHGGLGRAGRIAFWLFIAAPFVAAPFTWVAPIAWAVQMLIILTLLGVSMLNARVLPRAAVALFAFTPLVALALMPVVDKLYAPADGPWLLSFLAPVGVAFLWIGWAMSREPALDVRTTDSNGPIALA